MDWGNDNIRYVFSSLERSLPLYLESIGYSAWERIFQRPEGYPYYHWLHTLEGEGRFELHGESVRLTKGQGVLLKPFTPHSYYPASDRWSTIYITFGGASAASIMEALNMDETILYEEDDDQSFGALFNDLFRRIDQAESHNDVEVSTDLYYFLMQLRKFGMLNNGPSLSQYYRKLQPIMYFMEQHLAGNIGLPEIAEHAQIGTNALHELFQQAFDMSPYSYLIQLRLREAKKIMLLHPDLALREVAEQTGFNDVSHFVATFRKKEGITPGKYRELHVTAEQAGDGE
ncbi:helix-turn-helix transcriptional regulator [Paenibacillus senegalimassiliensis]|uniref:helix-turn-helix transcriptional regulator n=1 Tax=Paenibacillus senegalimassiliensis TaxID=1737426 RepID=UPI00073F2DF7|nr:AraC family transcriptional regulator [Paenibacillus senegalimassiliensis]